MNTSHPGRRREKGEDGIEEEGRGGRRKRLEGK